MPSPEGLLPVFYASSTIACLGFITLLTQLILGFRKSNASLDRIKKSSQVTTEDETQESTNPNSHPSVPRDAELGPEPPAAESQEEVTKHLRDEMDFLNSEFQAARPWDTTPEIASAMCAYLSAARHLLELSRGSGSTTSMTDEGLNTAAGRTVRYTIAETASLRALADTAKAPVLARVFLTGGLSLVAVWTVAAAHTADHTLVIGEPAVITFNAPFAGPVPDVETILFRFLLVTLCTSAATHAFVATLAGDLPGYRFIGLVFACPASVASSMAVVMWILGISPGVFFAGFSSSAALIIMTMFAAVVSFIACEEDELARQCEVTSGQDSCKDE